MFESGMLGLVNASMLIFSLISSLIIGAALYLLTSDLRPKSAGYLRKRVSLLEDLLRKSGVVGINANEVKEMVKNRFKCDVNRIERQNDVYVVMCKKGKQEFNTYVDVYDGAIVGTKCNTLVSFFLLNKKKIVGASIVIFFVIITLFNFKNLPRFDLIEGVANMVGIPKEQLSMFYEKDMAEGCVSITKLMIKYSTKINEMDLYENKRVQEEIESILDEKVIAMYKVEYNGNDYIISVSVPKNISSEQLGSKNILKISKVCSIYKNKLCDCMKTPV
ncbi:MAG TPA: hypothetical protein ENG42_00115 [Candidatus Aenigmarchaeota archaeon]|nr:hypothetical protein [Candidatus Aenigmarchaeota archaeon]